MSCNNKSNIKPDFLSSDFLSSDFFSKQTEPSYLVVFKNYLFEKLPYYFLSQDTYKNEQGEGLLQRYLTIFGDHIDEEIIPDIECYLNIIDSSLNSSAHLNILSDVLGNPPDIFKDEDKYRNLLTYIISVYKIKGTIEAYRLFFNILGFDIILTEVNIETLADIDTKYDFGGIYDNGGIYDADICQQCSEYDITYIPFNNSEVIVDEALLIRMQQSIAFNEPINAKLRNLRIGIQLEETININITENSTEIII